MKNVFVSTAIYALGRQMGIAAALVEIQKQLDHPTPESLPVARTIHRLRQLADVQLRLDCGATIIGHMRSRAFHSAHESGLDAWVSLDDDMDATTETCRFLLDVLEEDVLPLIVIVPCMMRVPEHTNTKLCVALPMVRSIRHAACGARLLRMPPKQGGGFGMVGMNRAAMQEMVLLYADDRDLQWDDEDGATKLALFHDMLINGLWYGEDTSFFRRVPATVSVEVLLTGAVNHAGIPLDLETL